MNYRHIYHAGNFSDVFKHVVLIDLVEALKRKEKAFCYVDTHAGIGRYDLQSTETQKTKEYAEGIGAVLAAEHIPKELKLYLKVVNEFNDTATLRYYPGSPRIVQSLLRDHDRMVLNELHPDDFKTLKQEFRREEQVSVHHRDAYEFLAGILPPSEKRGLILIDPAFEKTDELEQAHAGLLKALQRFATGVYAIWIPIKDRGYRQFYRALARDISQPMLLIELTLDNVPYQAGHLIGCAMVIINPPYGIEHTLQKTVKWLWELWGPKSEGRWNIEKIKPSHHDL